MQKMKGGFLLPIDVWLHLLEFVPPVTYAALRRAMPLFIRNTPRRFLPLVEFCMQRLPHYLPMSVRPELLHNLKQGRLWLTGGALLSLLQGVPPPLAWDQQDLDLCYMTSNDEQEHHELLYVCESRLVPDTAIYDASQGEREDAGDYPILGMSVIRYGFPAEGAAADYIGIRDANALRTFPKTFDLSFCGNMLCGTMLYIRDLTALIRMRCTLQPGHYLRHVYSASNEAYVAQRFAAKRQRIEKYRVRGYQVDVLPMTDDDEHAIRSSLHHYQVFVTDSEVLRYTGRLDKPPIMTHQEWLRHVSELRHRGLSAKIAADWRRMWSEYVAEVEGRVKVE